MSKTVPVGRQAHLCSSATFCCAPEERASLTHYRYQGTFGVEQSGGLLEGGGGCRFCPRALSFTPMDSASSSGAWVALRTPDQSSTKTPKTENAFTFTNQQHIPNPRLLTLSLGLKGEGGMQPNGVPGSLMTWSRPCSPPL